VGGRVDKQTHREHGELLSLLLLSQNKESRLKIHKVIIFPVVYTNLKLGPHITGTTYVSKEGENCIMSIFKTCIPP
jgi:hypothetical protein